MIITGAPAFVNEGRAARTREFLVKIRPKNLNPAKTDAPGQSGFFLFEKYGTIALNRAAAQGFPSAGGMAC